MGFSLVPKPVILNNLERRNGPHFVLFRFAELGSFGARYAKVIEDTSTLFAREM